MTKLVKIIGILRIFKGIFLIIWGYKWSRARRSRHTYSVFGKIPPLRGLGGLVESENCGEEGGWEVGGGGAEPVGAHAGGLETGFFVGAEGWAVCVGNGCCQLVES